MLNFSKNGISASLLGETNTDKNDINEKSYNEIINNLKDEE